MDMSLSPSIEAAPLTVLSGVGRKYPACFLANLGDQRIVLDMGLGSGTAPARPNLALANGPVDALILGHQHVDHLGSLDLLDALGTPPVYATGPVAQAALARAGVVCHPLPLGGTLVLGGVTVRTGRAGHAPGAVWLHLDDGARRVLYMGDHVDHSRLYPWEPPPETDLVIVDASYGVESVAQSSRVEVLMANLARDPVLLPVPVAGRGLEIALEMMDRDLPLPALCPEMRGMAASLARAERETAGGVIRTEAVPALERLAAEAPRADQPDRVTLVSGAVLENAFSLNIAARWARAGAPVIFTGHIPSHTPALAMVESGSAVWMRWNVHPTLPENIALIRAVGAKRAIPAFCDPGHWPLFARALPGVAIGP
jgi:hypothetical protein